MTSPSPRQHAAFDDRYGDGAHAQLVEQLGQPCVTFAHIAERFGVTRERVRQWHRQFLPNAPTGHERQQLCARYQQRRRLFQDDLFRAFFRHAREHFGPGRIEPLRARDGYRSRVVRIDRRLVALRDLSSDSTTGPAPVRYRGQAEFVYVKLAAGEFLFYPAALSGPPQLVRNSFAAFEDVDGKDGSAHEGASGAGSGQGVADRNLGECAGS